MVFLERGNEALLFAHVDACKMVPSRSLAAGTFVRQFVSGIQHQGPETPCNCFVRRSSSPTRYLTYTRLGVRSSRPNQEPKARVFLHYASQITSARIQELCHLLHASKESQSQRPDLTRHLLASSSLDRVRPLLCTQPFLFTLTSCVHSPDL